MNALHPLSASTVRLWLLPAVLTAAVAACAAPEVVVNGQVLDTDTTQLLRQRYGSVYPGRYWYDSVTGAWGPQGGPTAGWVQPALPLPAPLPADASGGGQGRLTGVFVNGRELHPLDVQRLQRFTGTPPWPGHWWIDAWGNFGALAAGRRGPPLGNLWALARSHGGGGRDTVIASGDGKRFVGIDSRGCGSVRAPGGATYDSPCF